MTEEWRTVVGSETAYEVSNLGRVRSLVGGVIKPVALPTGYLRASVSIGGRKRYYYVHRLVAQAFIPNLEDKPQVNHIDGDKTNNRLDNLEWCTPKENTGHSIRTGLIVYPTNSPRNSAPACRKGHEYTPENSIIVPSTGYRKCRECARISNLYSKRRRAELRQKLGIEENKT